MKSLFIKAATALFLLVVLVLPTLSQDEEDAIPAKVLEGGRQVGKAELVLDTGDVKTNFGYDIKVWLDSGSRLMIIKPQSGSRGSGIKSTYREYKIDLKNPKDSTFWREMGSGTAVLQMPDSGDVQKITMTITPTTKIVRDEEIAVKEKQQKLVIVLD